MRYGVKEHLVRPYGVPGGGAKVVVYPGVVQYSLLGFKRDVSTPLDIARSV